MKRATWTVCALVLVLLLTPAMAGKKGKKGKGGGKINYLKLMLKDKLPPVSKEDLALQQVDYAPGAPAVYLLEGEQHEYRQISADIAHTSTIYIRRLKILEDSGVETYSDFTVSFFRDTLIDRVEARTVLPDGSEIDASENVHQEESRTGDKIISIAFPKVERGAILDLLIETRLESVMPARWRVQHRIPVLDSRFILAPPKWLRFTSASRHLNEEEAQPGIVQSTRGMTFVWRFKNVEPIPPEPNQPPLADITKNLFIIPTSITDVGVHYDFASTWDRWAREQRLIWNDWIRTRRSKAKELAEQVAGGLETAVEKAEAVRAALRERVESAHFSDVPRNNSPDDTLAAGLGTSADVAGTAVAMLRSLGLEAHLVAFRHRDLGTIPTDFPMPNLFNDQVVRVRSEEGEFYFSPVAESAVTILPAYCRGVYGGVIENATTAPILLPDFKAGENRANRMAKLELDLDGNLSGTSTCTFRGIWAERWRSTLRNETEDRRMAIVQDRSLRTWMPGAILDSLEIENLSDDTENLVMKCTFHVEGYAVSAGKRLIVNPNVMGRMSTEDWSAERRISVIDLGGAFEENDTITLKLPKGYTDVKVPNGANFSAGMDASYKMTYSVRGSMIVAKRQLRINKYMFPAGGWHQVRQMFQDIANQDDQPVVVTLQ